MPATEQRNGADVASVGGGPSLSLSQGESVIYNIHSLYFKIREIITAVTE